MYNKSAEFGRQSTEEVIYIETVPLNVVRTVKQYNLYLLQEDVE